MNLTRAKFFLFVTAFLFLSVFSANAQSGKVTPKPTPTPPVEDEDDTERVFTDEIKVNITAFDKNGKFYSGVRAEDLVISEDGTLNQATSVRRIPANVLIVLDTGGEDRQAKDFRTTRETAKALIKSLQPEDSVALLEYNDKAEIIAEWTNNKEQLYEILDKNLKFGRRSRFVEALNLAVKFFKNSDLENRHLVLISDGLDSTSSDDERNAAIRNILTTDINVHVFSYTKQELEIVQQRGKVVTYGGQKRPELPPGAGIPVQGQTQTRPIVTINTDREMLKKIKERNEALQKSEKSLTELAENTNGIIFLPETREEMIEKTGFLARNIDSQYVVTYTPKRSLSEVRTTEERNIQITSRRDGLEVLARRKLVVKPEKK